MKYLLALLIGASLAYFYLVPGFFDCCKKCFDASRARIAISQEDYKQFSKKLELKDE